MKKIGFSFAFLFMICVIVPRVFPVEISKDTVYVNDIDYSSCDISSARIDTLKIWNTVDSSVTMDTLEIIINPLQDGLFVGTDCRKTRSDSMLSEIGIAIYVCKDSLVWREQTYYDTLVWIETGKIPCIIMDHPDYNELKIPCTSIYIADVPSFLSFTGADTCIIYAILIGGCLLKNCVGQFSQWFFIDFSAQITLYYSNGSRVSFVCFNNYSSEVKRMPKYHIPFKVNIPSTVMFNVKGQLFNRCTGSYSPGIYLRPNGNNHHELKLFLRLNPAFIGGEWGDAP